MNFAVQRITAEDAEAEPLSERLFAPTLPKDLRDKGFKLIARHGKVFAVSSQWGCTNKYDTINEVAACAYRIMKYLEWRERKNLQAGRERTA